jgi:hypothetical protein
MNPAVVAVGAAAIGGVLYALSRNMADSAGPANDDDNRETELPAQAEVAQFVNEAYTVEAPASTGTTTGNATGATTGPTTGTTSGTTTGMAGQVAGFAGELIATRTNVLAAVSIAGQAADFANTGVRKNTEELFKDAGLEKELQAFEKRQGGYDMVSGRIGDEALKGAERVLQGAPPLVQDFGKGVAKGLGSLANAPVEVSALFDSAISATQARYQSAQTDADRALVVLGAKDRILTDVVFNGVGSGLADMIAKTPEERAKADEVLQLINPSNQVDRLTTVIKPAVEASLKETADRLAREKAARDAAAKAISDRLAADRRARDAAAQASLKATADRLAREKREREEKLAREKRERDAAAKATADRLARERREREAALAASNAKARSDLQNIGNAFRDAFTPRR